TDGLYNPLILDALIAAGYDRSFEQIHGNTHLKLPTNVTDWHEIEIHIKQREVRLPSQIDLGGVAKGWAAEQIADQLSPYGACLVDLGGDMVARGRPEGQTGWRVA